MHYADSYSKMMYYRQPNLKVHVYSGGYREHAQVKIISQ